ncbi:t1pks [Neopestalotiopsis sp. 37M]|nr:t1pks [Neopestalotiopsis sp. 37M]
MADLQANNISCLQNGDHRNHVQDPPLTDPVPIAIVGMSMRLPGGVDDEEKYWDLLVNKRDAISPVPENRYRGHGKAGHMNTNQGYFLKDLDLAQMDAGFFSMSKAEADQLDPHHRLLLEVVYEAFESAGEKGWRGKDVGCYVGFSAEDWNDLQAKDPQDFPIHRMTGTFDFALANRISFVIKAACASSLLSFHVACEAVAHGQCSSAVVCGANLVLTPAMTVALYEAGALSADTSCKTFDVSANGYARADAINAVYIKRLDHAIRDGNPIRAIVRSTATNFDGKTSGISNPSTSAQEALIRKTYQLAGLDTAETAFCECHGTGTAVGDPLEAQAVANVWQEAGGVLIGSVKPNVGHAEAASGISSIIKSVLCLEKKTIVPNIKFNNPNPKIPWKSAGLVVPTEPTAWPKGRKERISVNNFGFGGANCHVILDSADSYLPSSSEKHDQKSETVNGTGNANGTNGIATNGHTNGVNGNGVNGHGVNGHSVNGNGVNGHSVNGHSVNGNGVNGNGVNGHDADGEQSVNPSLLVFSANHEESLANSVQALEEFCSQEQPSITDLAYTLGARREHMPYRTYAVTDNSARFDAIRTKSKVENSGAKPVFVFTGQGAQWPGMGKELMTAHDSFLQDIRTMDSHLAQLEHPASFSIETELQKPASESLLDQAQYAQPICAAVQIALVNLIRSWGVYPSAVVGHSGGDIAAAYAAGVYTMEDALTIAYYRGVALKSQTRPGGMAAVGLGADEVAPLLPQGLSLACLNSGSSVTISGDESILDTFIADFKKTRPDVFAHHMHDVGVLYQQLLEGCITPRDPIVPYYSTVKDRFHSGVKAILNHSELAGSPHLEIGPHSALAGPLKQIYKEVGTETQYMSLLTRNADARKSVLKAVGQLFAVGVDIDFAAMYPKGSTLPNLPKYAWHREGNFWHESRVMKMWRLKEFPHHDLLGSRVAEASDLVPVWRNLVSPDTVPGWVREHVMRTQMEFPAAAYVVMAGEAITQLCSGSDYTVRNVTVNSTSPVVIRPGESVEIITSLQPYRLTTTTDSEWYDFSIVSNSTSGWVKHCHGQVRSGPGSKYAVGDTPLLPRSVPSGRWYKAWRRLGLEYGPSFRGLQDVSVHTDRKEVSAVVVEGLTESESTYQLHPTSLAMIIQAIDVAIHHGLARAVDNAEQLTYIEELYVGPGAGKHTRIHLQAEVSPGGTVVCNGYGKSRTGELSVVLKNITKSRIASDSDGRGNDPHGAMQLEWKPDVDMVDPGTLIKPRLTQESATAKLEKLFLLCAAENLLQLQGHTAPEDHLQKFHDWLGEVVEFAKAGKSRVVTGAAELCELSSPERQALIEELMDQARDTPDMDGCRIIYEVYKGVVDVFDGKVDALEMLLRDNMLTAFYNFFDWIDYSGLVELLGHENPNLRVLEIGAGMGSTTENVLKNLKDSSGHRLYSTFFYTDISAGFFIKAKERFKDYAGIEYRTFDVTRAPAEQDFEEGSFDIVLAHNVLHATPSLSQSLTNVRKLLRPRGRLILSELCPESKFMDYAVGLLPGWWLGEADGRGKQPWVLPERWDQELRKTGFDGVESVCYDQKQPYQQNAMMIARATDVASQQKSQRFTLVAPDATSPSTSALEDYLRAKGFEVDRCSLTQRPPPGQTLICTYELESAFLHDMKESRFRALVSFLGGLEDCTILWLTRSAQMAASDPRYSLINGMARTIRSEYNLPFGVLEVDCLDQKAWDATVKVVEKLQTSGNRAEETDPDYEYALHEGVVHVSRFSGVSVTKELANVGVRDSPRHLQIGKKGALETLQWAAWPYEGALGSTEVEVDVRVTGMNNGDLYTAMGVSEGDSFGYECAGVVHQVGSEVQDLQIGDRVMVLSQQSLCSRLRTSSQRCIKIPDGLSFEEAATMPSIYATVIRGLLTVGNLESGQTVLVQAAAGPAGMAAMYICKAVGAEVYATTDSEERATFLAETFGLGRDHIFSSKDNSFKADVQRATDGRGVDLVLNSLTGELLHASWECVAENGVMIEVGKRDMTGHGKLALDLFQGNRGFFGVDVARLCKGRPQEAKKLLKTIIDMYEAGEIKPPQTITAFDASNILEAFQFMQKRDYDGKVAVHMPEDSNVLPGVALLGQRDLFRPDVSYLLVGGLGGIGQAIATWMVERGAKNLIFLSRSAADRNVHGTFFDELEASGCSVQPFSGDVASLEDVKRVAAEASKPIAGVMQMALVLRDQSLAKMTIDEWNGPITPKVRGTWNLHEVLGNSLDFFLMYSSVCGLGGQFGQANYAAANTFLDAFAQYRQGLGLPASVLDIGVMEDVGFLTATGSLGAEGALKLEPLRASGYWMLVERDLVEALELMIWRSSSKSSPPAIDAAVPAYTSPNQLGLGLRTTLPLSDPRNRVVWRRDRRMAAYQNDDGDHTATGATASDDTLSKFLASVADNPAVIASEDSARVLAQEIGKHLSSILRVDEDDLDLQMGLADLGVDSLIMIEIRNWLRQKLGTEFATAEILEAGSIMSLGQLAAERLRVKYDAAIEGKGN